VVSMAVRQLVFITIVLIFLSLVAGCTDTSPESPPLQTMSTLPVPGSGSQDTPLLQVFGDTTGKGIPGGTIDTITFEVGLIDIHKSVDMEHLTIVYADAIRTETLRPVEGFHGDPPKGFWSITRVENEVGDPNNRLDNEERFFITINPKAPLVPRQILTIDVKPQNGHSLTIRRVAPPSIFEDNILLPP
jgi:archaellin